ACQKLRLLKKRFTFFRIPTFGKRRRIRERREKGKNEEIF
ncbi:MAG: hypothetical protein ACI81P_003628, partial [Neolewinella sp.]